MNETKILELVNDNLKAVEVCFVDYPNHRHWEPDTNYLIQSRPYTYITLIADIKKGDEVLVEAKGNFSVAVVTKVLSLVPETDYDLKWVVARINATELSSTLNRTRDNVWHAYRKLKMKAQKESLRKALSEELGEDFKQLMMSDMQ